MFNYMYVLFVKDIDRLARTDLTMTSKSLINKLASWEDCLYMNVEKSREGWERGEKKKNIRFF